MEARATHLPKKAWHKALFDNPKTDEPTKGEARSRSVMVTATPPSPGPPLLSLQDRGHEQKTSEQQHKSRCSGLKGPEAACSAARDVPMRATEKKRRSQNWKHFQICNTSRMIKKMAWRMIGVPSSLPP